MTNNEAKLLFAGPTGVGKTTAITAISDTPPVSTDVAATDSVAKMKAKTTVAMDYATLTLEDGTQLSLYGTPGQDRFEFMWKILSRGALGLLLLVDASSPTAAEEMQHYIDGFSDMFKSPCVAIIGLNKVDADQDLTQFENVLRANDIRAPMMAVDVRQSDDVRMLIDVLLTTIEFA